MQMYAIKISECNICIRTKTSRLGPYWHYSFRRCSRFAVLKLRVCSDNKIFGSWQTIEISSSSTCGTPRSARKCQQISSRPLVLRPELALWSLQCWHHRVLNLGAGAIFQLLWCWVGQVYIFLSLKFKSKCNLFVNLCWTARSFDG